MLHIERFVHSTGNFNFQVLIRGIFGNIHLMPLRCLQYEEGL